MSNWIKSAIKHPGAFTAQAKRAGKSVHSFAVEKKDAGGTTGKRARLALTLSHMSHKKHAGSEHVGKHLK